MPEYGFLVARILPCKERLVDSVFIREVQANEISHSYMFYAVLISNWLKYL